jgi:hypothetical protein
MLIADEIKKRPELAFFTGENHAIGQAWENLRAEVEKGLDNAVSGNVYWSATILRTRVLGKLLHLADLKTNWDSYGAPRPNQIALENAGRILQTMKPFDLSLANVVPSAEGGIGFCFVNGNRYADIECSNDGEIIGVRYVGKQMPILIETNGSDTSLEAAMEQIRNHVRA